MLKSILFAAVLFAITSNVAEAAKIDPNPIGKPVGGGKVFGSKTGPECDYDLLQCIDQTAGKCVDMVRYGPGPLDGCIRRKKRACDIIYRKCRPKGKTLPPSKVLHRPAVPLKSLNMPGKVIAPTKGKPKPAIPPVMGTIIMTPATNAPTAVVPKKRLFFKRFKKRKN